ncbi:hypothetical protein SAMN02745157_3978 [Kaistia soli DSM 19436]|uniref:Uncharacterized protein n=1 Tax=Kaistia soli DSM 19436 TaxID=1122133 RepID=A0A1M5IRR5_9HYPH|nr:hypothetical protein SAMN02745157_3978 [Kaistia soli DSM 19436]
MLKGVFIWRSGETERRALRDCRNSDRLALSGHLSSDRVIECSGIRTLSTNGMSIDALKMFVF